MFRMRFNILFFTFLFFTGKIFCQVNRIPNSIYPSSSIPDSLYVLNDLIHSDEELFVIQNLQGLLSKEKPMIFRDRGSGSSIWLNDMSQNYGIVTIDFYDTNLVQLLSDFKDDLNGYILCNAFDESSNVALSISGITGAIPVPEELEQIAISAGLGLFLDVRDKNYEWVLDNYDDQLSKDVIIYQKEQKGHFLGDYGIFSNAFYFYDDIHGDITKRAFGRMNSNSVLFGWGDDEYQTIRKASEYGIGVHPADWAFNLSTLTNLNATIAQKIPVFRDTVTIPNTHTVCFLMSDGDNIQWMLNLFADDTRWFGSANRGQMPIGWTIPPALAELGPSVMNKLYDMAENSAQGRDYFVAGPSGNTYNFPDFFSDNEGQCSIMNEYLQVSDLNIVNILGNDDSPLIISQFTELEEVDGVFYYDYGNYSKGQGKIYCDSWKPIIQSRYNLWGGFETGFSLANKLNALPRDPSEQDGYSLIAVHAWSNSVDSLLFVNSLLENGVRVVSPDDFVYLVKNNLCRENPESIVYPNPTSDLIHIQFSEMIEVVSLRVTDVLGREIPSTFNSNVSANATYIDIDIDPDAQGIYTIQVISNKSNYKIERVIKL